MAELVDALVSDASGETRGSSSLLGRTNLKTMKNPYKKRINWKIIAVIIEISIFVVGAITVLVLDSLKIKYNKIPFIVISAVLLFILVLTLSVVRYDSFRAIRSNKEAFKDNMPIYTDQQTMICHDLIDENKSTPNKEE